MTKEETYDLIKQLAVDFAWENLSILNKQTGYQKFLSQFDNWYIDNKYIESKVHNLYQQSKQQTP